MADMSGKVIKKSISGGFGEAVQSTNLRIEEPVKEATAPAPRLAPNYNYGVVPVPRFRPDVLEWKVDMAWDYQPGGNPDNNHAKP